MTSSDGWRFLAILGVFWEILWGFVGDSLGIRWGFFGDSLGFLKIGDSLGFLKIVGGLFEVS